LKGEKKMVKNNFQQFVRSLQDSIAKHSPEILTGVGIAGMVTTTVLAVTATPKALRLIEARKDELAVDDERPEKLDKLEVVKTCWKCYIPAAISGTLSATCLICANSVNARRNAALATAYKLSESALTEYQSKVVETIGEKKEQAIKDEIAKEKLEKDPVCNREVIITEKGNTLCYDVISGRYFKSDIERIRKAENVLNRRLIDEMYVTLNEFYSEIGLSPTAVGEDLGWDIDKGLIEIHFSTQLADDETPCLVVDYSVSPPKRYRY
jgi:hypothetical protein